MMTTLARPKRNVSLAVQVTDQMRELIETGQWPLGSRIPAEHQLSTELGVSRNTVREALRSLVHVGLIEARAGDGTYVRADSELWATLDRRVRRSSMDEAFEVRSMLEERGARLAAMRADATQLERLGEFLSARDTAREHGDTAAYVEADVAFHDATVAAGGNALLTELYRHSAAAIAETVARSTDVRQRPDAPGLVRTEIDELHHALFDAIVGRDPDAAGRLATGLIEESRRLSAQSVAADPAS
jgi:DNA-binding FadR family transcriptional regulator